MIRWALAIRAGTTLPFLIAGAVFAMGCAHVPSQPMSCDCSWTYAEILNLNMAGDAHSGMGLLDELDAGNSLSARRVFFTQVVAASFQLDRCRVGDHATDACGFECPPIVQDKFQAARDYLAALPSERNLFKEDPETRFYLITWFARQAFSAKRWDEARELATEAVEIATHWKNDWNYGNNVHQGHTLLGLMDLADGKKSSAVEHLLASSAVEGSPQLDTAGPKISLATRLYEQGERETIISFLEAVAKFWDEPEIPTWINELKTGRAPGFLERCGQCCVP